MTTRLDPALFGANPLWGRVLTEQGGPLSGSAWAAPAAIAAMLLVGAAMGLFNGIAVAKWKMPPFMVTLITMFFFGGLAIYATRSENIGNLPAGFVAIGTGGVWTVALERGMAVLLPYSLFVAAPLALVAQAFLTRTVWGRWFYAVGINREAARVSGLPTGGVTIAAYVLSGVFAAIGSVLYTARLGNARPTLGDTMLLDIIAAAVIGGISLYGGRGKVSGAVFGVLFFVLLSNALNQMNLSFYTVNIVKGMAIAAAAMLDAWRKRRI
jgi:ribose transport system permease protein